MTETEFVQALRALMRSRSKSDDFVVDHQGCAIRVEYFSGSGSHVVLSTPYVGRAVDGADGYRSRAALEGPRPMRIELRREKASDVRAKASGVAVEAQTGDDAFDASVYVDSPSSHEIVRGVLGAQALRDAARSLLSKGVGPITLDDTWGRIQVRISDFGGIRNALTVLTCFAAIAGHVPEVTATGKAHPIDPGRGIQFLMGGAAIVGIVPTTLSMAMLLPDRCYESDDEGTSLVCSEPGCCAPALGGLGGGALFGTLLAAVLFSRIRGTSSSHKVRWWVALFALLLGIEAGVVVTHILGGVLLRFT